MEEPVAPLRSLCAPHDLWPRKPTLRIIQNKNPEWQCLPGFSLELVRSHQHLYHSSYPGQGYYSKRRVSFLRQCTG